VRAKTLVRLRRCSPQCLSASPVLGPSKCRCRCRGRWHGNLGDELVRPKPRQGRECVGQAALWPRDEALAAA
jgi:hypothetical protein